MTLNLSFMKKLNFIYPLLILLIFACSKDNDDLNCNCEAEGEKSSLNIGNKTFKTTLYKEKNNDYSFYSSNLKNIDEIYNLFDNEQKDLSGLILYTNKPNNIINENDINGLVTFVKNGNFFEVNIYKKTNKIFEKINRSNLNSYYISANDLNDLNSLYFNNSKTIISIINFEHIKRPKLIKAEFQKELRSEMSSKGLLRRGGKVVVPLVQREMGIVMLRSLNREVKNGFVENV